MQTLNILRIFQMRSDERESPLGHYTSSTQLPLLQYSYVQILLKELVLLLNIYPLQLCINNRFSTAQPQHLQPGSLHKDTMDQADQEFQGCCFFTRPRQTTNSKAKCYKEQFPVYVKQCSLDRLLFTLFGLSVYSVFNIK